MHLSLPFTASWCCRKTKTHQTNYKLAEIYDPEYFNDINEAHLVQVDGLGDQIVIWHDEIN